MEYGEEIVLMGLYSFRRSVACGGEASISSAVGNAHTHSSNTRTSNSTTKVLTITISEAQQSPSALDKQAIAVNKGDLVTRVTQSNEDLNFDEGDTAKAGVDFIVAGKDESPVIFPTAGT